ncbi:MAG: hypothetical protein RSB98_00950 [Raoultibacter sp.]
MEKRKTNDEVFYEVLAGLNHDEWEAVKTCMEWAFANSRIALQEELEREAKFAEHGKTSEELQGEVEKIIRHRARS